MSADYYSKLIDSLYQAGEAEVESIAEEMLEIGDPIFLYPLYSAYKRNAKNWRGIGLIVALMSFNDPEVVTIATELALNPNTESNHLLWVYPVLNKASVFPTEVIARAIDELKLKSKDPEIMAHEVSSLSDYIAAAGTSNEHIVILNQLAESNDVSRDVQRTALYRFLKANPTEHWKYFYDNYKSTTGSRLEVLLAHELTSWTHGIIPQFRTKVLEDGSSRARDILQKFIAQQQAAEVLQHSQVEAKQTNAAIIGQIAEKRRRINELCVVDSRFGFRIFSSSELLYQQQEAPDDNARFTGYCIDLKSFIQHLDAGLEKHNLSMDEARALILGLSNLKGSINNLELYLLNNEIECGVAIKKLRLLNRLLSKLAHPEEKGDIQLLLEEADLKTAYVGGEWSVLHAKLLTLYLEFLNNLSESISKGGRVGSE